MHLNYRLVLASLARRSRTPLPKNLSLAACNAAVIVASALLIATVLQGPLNASASLSDNVNTAVVARARLLERARLVDDIHNSFQVPWRLLRPLSSSALRALLAHLRTPPDPLEPLPITKRRAVFAHITGTDPWDRTRALASVLAYARATGRVAVVYWYLHADYTALFEDTFDVDSHRAGCAPLVFANIPDDDLALQDKYRRQDADATLSFSALNADVSAGERGDELRNVVDDAEFSLRECADPESADTTFSATGGFPRLHAVLPRGSSDASIVEVLEDSAARSIHIAFTLSDAIRSRYTALHDAEECLQRCVRGRTAIERLVVDSAHLAVKDVGQLDTTTLLRTLHDDFKLPWVLLAGLRTHMARFLLDKLMAQRRDGMFAPRIIWVQPQFGLGNRLRVLGSVLALARATRRVLVVIWVRDAHLDCAFSDLFLSHDDVVVSESFDPGEEWPLRKLHTLDPAMGSVLWYNYMRVNGAHVNNPSEAVRNDPTRHLFVSSAYVVQSNLTPGVIKTQSEHWHVLRELTPIVPVGRLVLRASHWFARGEVMGVHVRARNIANDIRGVDHTAYTGDAARTTDYWRSLTNVDAFLTEMHRQKSRQRFYIAADDRAVLRIFEREFPGRILYTPRDCDDRDSRCLPYALADILLLARCPSIRGSYWSSFTELSCRWGGTRFQLAGVDFGKPIRKSTNSSAKSR